MRVLSNYLTSLFIAPFCARAWGAILGTLIMIVVWLALIKHFFDCGWLKSLVIAVVAGIIYLIISLILSAILVMLGFSPLPSLW